MVQRSTINWRGDRPSDNYTIIPNELARDPDISAPAKAVAVYIWSCKDGFQIGTALTAKTLGMRKEIVVKAMSELIDQGWLSRKELTGPEGRTYGWQYHADPSKRIKRPNPKTTKTVRHPDQ